MNNKQIENKKYDKSTVEFLESWGITVEQNEENLKKIEDGQLVQISIGGDTGIRKIAGCYDEHKKYHRDSASGWVTYCDICDFELFDVFYKVIFC